MAQKKSEQKKSKNAFLPAFIFILIVGISVFLLTSPSKTVSGEDSDDVSLSASELESGDIQKTCKCTKTNIESIVGSDPCEGKNVCTGTCKVTKANGESREAECNSFQVCSCKNLDVAVRKVKIDGQWTYRGVECDHPKCSSGSDLSCSSVVKGCKYNCYLTDRLGGKIPGSEYPQEISCTTTSV